MCVTIIGHEVSIGVPCLNGCGSYADLGKDAARRRTFLSGSARDRLCVISDERKAFGDGSNGKKYGNIQEKGSNRRRRSE